MLHRTLWCFHLSSVKLSVLVLALLLFVNRIRAGCSPLSRNVFVSIDDNKHDEWIASCQPAKSRKRDHRRVGATKYRAFDWSWLARLYVGFRQSLFIYVPPDALNVSPES